MWHEHSYCSDVYLLGAKLEWGKGGKDYDTLGGLFLKTFVHNLKIDNYCMFGKVEQAQPPSIQQICGCNPKIAPWLEFYFKHL